MILGSRFDREGALEFLGGRIELMIFQKLPAAFLVHGRGALARDGVLVLQRWVEGVVLEGLFVSQNGFFPTSRGEMLIASFHIGGGQRPAGGQQDCAGGDQTRSEYSRLRAESTINKHRNLPDEKWMKCGLRLLNDTRLNEFGISNSTRRDNQFLVFVRA